MFLNNAMRMPLLRALKWALAWYSGEAPSKRFNIQPAQNTIQRLAIKGLGTASSEYQVGAHLKALDEGILLVPLDPRYNQVGFNLISVQVCSQIEPVRCGCRVIAIFLRI